MTGLPAAEIAPDGRRPPATFPERKVTTVVLDSRDRDYTKYPSSSEFALRLPETLHNVRAAKLVDAQVPSTFYVFSEARGTTALVVTHSTNRAVVAVGAGNYTASEMATELKLRLDQAFASTVPTVTWDVSLDATTQTFALVPTPPGAVSVDTTGAPDRPTDFGAAYYLGFPGGTVTGADAGSRLTSPHVANMNPETYLCLHVEELDGIDQCALYARGGSGRRCFAKVPLDGNSFSRTVYDETAAVSTLRRQADVSKLSVSLRFHDGTLVDLNGAEWSFTVRFSHTEVR